MQRIKGRRLKILHQLQRFQEGGVTDLAGVPTRQVVKHRGSRSFRQPRAEDCRNHRLIPQTADTDSLLDVPSQKRKSAKLEREGK